MSVKAIGEYSFPSADRAENFGDDMLVFVMWRGNPMMVAPAAFRAPRGMAWADFKAQMVDPWAASDPDYDPSAARGWLLYDSAFSPEEDRSLVELGLDHKDLVSFET